MIVRWGLDRLPALLGELGASAPFLLATPRWDAPVAVAGRWSELPTDELRRIDVGGADVLLALGGGSTIDTAKALSARTELPVVSIPTTYSGAEWTRFFGVRDARRRRTGAGGGAKLAGIVYDVEPTLSLSREVTAGTALNALAHCCEALYVRGRDTAADELASAGAREILDSLPRVLDDPRDREARTVLLRGAAHGGEALARSGLALGHALAQVIGGRYGISHGALNALCLPPALRFNAEFVPPVLGPDPAAVAESLARRAGFTSLRELGVPEGDLPELAAAIEGAPGARANPRPASAAEILALLHEMH